MKTQNLIIEDNDDFCSVFSSSLSIEICTPIIPDNLVFTE